MAFTLESATDIQKLQSDAIRENLDYVAKALTMIKAQLNGQTALLGFAGSPWTLANFMVEGGSARDYSRARIMYHTEPQLYGQLLAKITAAVIEFLHLQIDAGVDAVQIFDSLGGSLPSHNYMSASGRWIQEIVEAIQKRVPVIVFPKGVHGQWRHLAATGASVLGADWTVSLPEIRGEVPEHVGLQGNLDPCLLTTTPEIVAKETERILREMRGSDGFIFNLGHGVPPNAKLECIESLVKTVQGSR
jgi:uroporphyrinogen decarboxylase